MNHQPDQRKPVIVRDKRRPDPATLQPRPQSADDKPVEIEPRAGRGALGTGSPARPQHGTKDRPRTETPSRAGARTQSQPEPVARTEAEVAALRVQLQERTADLQRLKAEYDNYRKRVRRDRLVVGEIAVANVLAGLLPVLDAIDRAREYGEVTGGFRRVVEALETRLATLGLESFGRPGDSFDPAVHEALSHTRTGQADRPVCTTVHRPGYRVGGQLLRPAQVNVAESPVEPPGESAAVEPPGESAAEPGARQK